MGNHTHFVLDYKNYQYAFLSAAVQETLRQSPNSPIDDEGIRHLEQAKSFLADVVAGTKFVALGESSAVSPGKVFDALAYALQPLIALQQLRTLTTLEVLMDHMKAMIGVLEISIAERKLTGSEVVLASTANFFQYLKSMLVSSLNRRGRTIASSPVHWVPG